LDGVVAAIEHYEDQLRQGSLDDLWNRPRRGQPSPKEEERVSDKLCAAIHDYFRDYAVGAKREVQISRRFLSERLGGAPGSRGDVLYRVPPTTTVHGDPIVVPIEVKLAHNRQAGTNLRTQLVNRYMSELSTDFGVFVVVWMGTLRRYKAIWDSPRAAKEELTGQAREIMSSSDGLDVRVVVIDASLPRAP
jgi:hypothetical protein